MKVIGCTWAAREYVATRDRGTRPVRHDMAKSISISLATSANQRDATTTYTSIFSWKRRERERERAKREGKGKRFPRRKFQPCARSLYSLATTKRLRFQRIDGIPIGKARGGEGGRGREGGGLDENPVKGFAVWNLVERGGPDPGYWFAQCWSS